jgi:capsular exopolysaccharide synthesis family protein
MRDHPLQSSALAADRTQLAPAAGPGDGGLAPFLRAVKVHWKLVAMVTLAAVAGSVALLLLLPRQYEATASVLVSPLPEDDQTFLGLGLLRDTGDPTRTVQTAATILESFEAAELAAQRLGEPFDAGEILDSVRVEPQGESNVLAVTASATDASVAANLANEFASSALDLRRQSLERQLAAVIEQLEGQERTGAAEDAPDADQASVADRLGEVQALEDQGGDPTLTVAQPAQPPSSAVGAPRWLIVAAALLAGLAVGTLTAYAMESINPRVRDQDEFVSLFPLEVLSGVPRLRRRERASSVASPVAPTPLAREAYRTLRMQLQQGADRRTFMVTSASSGDGKTTVAVNLAYSMIGAGNSVVLVDFDLRRPAVASVVGMSAERGLAAVLRSDVPLEELLVEPPHAPGLRVLPAVEGDAMMLELVNRAVPELLQRLSGLADYVIVDTPPLGEVSDPLQIAAQVDEVVVVARPRHTNRRSFQVMRDLLSRSGMTPAGLFVVGQAAQPMHYGYYQSVPIGNGSLFGAADEPSSAASGSRSLVG